MVVTSKNHHFILSVLLPIFFCTCSDAIKCFECNSANNSACLDMHLHKMHAIVPVVDCAKAAPSLATEQYFCRKITQTILDPEKSPELRVTRGCGWIKHKRECYSADNKDHLETVCQCFGDMCNAATPLSDVTLLAGVGAILVLVRMWRESV